MRISTSKARQILGDLVTRARRGEVIVLTRHGKPVVQLRAFPARLREEDAKVLARIIANAPFKL